MSKNCNVRENFLVFITLFVVLANEDYSIICYIGNIEALDWCLRNLFLEQVSETSFLYKDTFKDYLSRMLSYYSYAFVHILPLP